MQKYDTEAEAENSKKSSLPELHKTNGWRVSTSIHARSQALIRHPHKTTEDWQALHRNIVHGLMKSKDRNNGMHLIHSASHDHSVIAAVNHAKKEVSVITVLHKGKAISTHAGDHSVTVENVGMKSFKDFIAECQN